MARSKLEPNHVLREKNKRHLYVGTEVLEDLEWSAENEVDGSCDFAGIISTNKNNGLPFRLL